MVEGGQAFVADGMGGRESFVALAISLACSLDLCTIASLFQYSTKQNGKINTGISVPLLTSCSEE